MKSSRGASFAFLCLAIFADLHTVPSQVVLTQDEGRFSVADQDTASGESPITHWRRKLHAASGEGEQELRVLHLGFHAGAGWDLRLVGEGLGLKVEFEVFPSASSPDDGCSKFNVDAETAARVWAANGARWREYDVIITSDTAPIARTFLEHGRLRGHQKLIVWICNRIDYRCDGPDGAPRIQPHYPDPALYSLFRRASQGGLGPNVRVVPYNQFEVRYAGAVERGVRVTEEVVRPSGLKSRLNSSNFTDGCARTPTSLLPSAEEAAELFFLPPRGNDRFMAVQCQQLGLRCFGGRDPGAQSVREVLTRPHAVAYETAAELSAFRAVLHIPYAWSTFALFEFAVAGLVTWVPSRRFYLELAGSCIAWGAWLCEAMPAYALWLPNFGMVVEPEVLDDAEWWNPANADLFVYFDSWEHLEELSSSLDLAPRRRRLRAWADAHVNRTLEQWRQLIIGGPTGQTTPHPG